MDVEQLGVKIHYGGRVGGVAKIVDTIFNAQFISYAQFICSNSNVYLYITMSI
jgi:hypothetical protein